MSTKTAEERALERYFEAALGNKDGGTDMRIGYATCIREVAEPLEAENAKLRALVQGLFNAWHTADGGHDMHKWISAAKKQGFVPTNTTQDNG